ncbi:uncharacterized protein [Aegilops tauschii subsp. strangulata]|uniref:uncharacterized protein n=1 Tax=Aegilops tauschii subsp. strangulata TaxID=200361 RepID=UPI003CC84685
MIQECGDYKSLDPADILERLNTHEFQLAEKRDLYGSSYGRSRALKAKAVSESEGEDYGSSLGDLEELSQELALLVMKFQKFSRRGCFGKSSRSNDSSSSDYKKRLCHKCKKPGHYIQDCPQWEKESKKKKYKDYSSDDSKKKNKSSKSSSSKSSKSSSHMKSSSKKARSFIGKEMDSEAESEEHEEEESSEEPESGEASLALATAFVSKSIFNTKENGFYNKADDNDDDYAPTYCFMAKGAKVLKYPSSESSEDESDENLKPSYSKLAKVAVKQQKAFEKNALACMALFAHLCEGFAGVHPNLALFRHYFFPRIQKGDFNAHGLVPNWAEPSADQVQEFFDSLAERYIRNEPLLVQDTTQAELDYIAARVAEAELAKDAGSAGGMEDEAAAATEERELA